MLAASVFAAPGDNRPAPSVCRHRHKLGMHIRMSRKPQWFRLGLSAWSLGVDASSVIALRMMKIGAGGKGGEAEAGRMINEKIDAGLDLQRMVMTGALNLSGSGVAAKTLGYYRRKVRANRRRLINGR
jgi:hypothetical protein